MRVCSSCGFDKAPDDGECPLCNQPVTYGMSHTPTITLEPSPQPAKAPTTVLGEGDVVAGRYWVVRSLGAGGMGGEFEVHDSVSGHPVALKVMLPEAEEADAGLERFQREIRILAALEHPAIPKVYDWGTSGGRFFFTTELVDGSDLARLLATDGTFAADRAAEIVAAAAGALHAAHTHGIIHRDLKPHNIMVASDGAVRIVDFGIARGRTAELGTVTRSGMIVGTPQYMAPEQHDGGVPDERSDIYSLGVVLFELVTGRLPFDADSPIALAILHRTEDAPDVRDLNQDVPAWLARIVATCLRKKPGDRYPSAAALAEELHRRPGASEIRRRRLPNGDALVDDPAERTDWALVLESSAPKRDWEIGTTVRFDERFFRLDGVEEVEGDERRWVYRFRRWPEGEVFRHLVEYDASAAPDASDERGALKHLFRRS